MTPLTNHLVGEYVDFLETLFFDLAEEKEPDTPEYRENQTIQRLILEDIQKAMGQEMAEKVTAIYSDREALECQRYFRCGVKLGLELLRL